ncbi:MAG: ATP-binding protein [Bradymonadia bacterium]
MAPCPRMLSSRQLEALAATARTARDPESERVVTQWARAAAQEDDDSTRAIAALLLGAREVDLGHAREGLSSLESACTLAQAALNPTVELAALREVTRGLTLVGRHADALEKAGPALALARSLQVPEIEIVLVINVGILHGYRSDPVPYAEHMTYALELARRIDDKRLIAHCSINLGGALARMRRDDDALACYAEAEACLEHVDWLEGRALVLAGRGGVYGEQERLIESEAAFEASNHLLLSLGRTFQVVRQTQQFTHLCLISNDTDRALAYAQQAIELCRGRQFGALELDLLRLTARLREYRGEYREAFEALDRATELAEALQERASNERFDALQAGHRLDVARATAANAQAEAVALAASNATLRGLLDALPHAVVVCGAQQTLWMNAAAQRWLGQPGLALLGESLFDRLVVADNHRTTLQYGRLREAPAQLQSVSMCLPSGEMRDVQVSTCALDFEGQPAVMFALHDLTEYRRLESRVQHLDRLSALSTLVGGISHEVNNPLAYIIANLNFAIAELGHLNLPEDDDRLCALREAEEGAVRVRTVMQGLKALAAPPGREHITGSLVASLREAVAVVQASVGTRPEVTLSVRDEDTRVVGAESQLVQVFVNLLLHAVAASQDLTDRPARVEVVHEPSTHEFARIVVRDNGQGLDDARRRRLFDPYSGPEHITPGSGLSVSLAVRTVQTLGGHIDAHSVEGVGTVLTIDLPRLHTTRSVPEEQVV